MFSRAKRPRATACRVGLLLCALAFSAGPGCAQRERGELRLEVRDPQGRTVSASGTLVSEANQIHREFSVPADGRYLAEELPFGVYRVSVAAEGFAEWSELIEVRSTVPVTLSVTLG